MKATQARRQSPAAPTAATTIIAAHAATALWTPPAATDAYDCELWHSTTGLCERTPEAAPAADHVFAFTCVTGQSYYSRIRALLSGEPGPWVQTEPFVDPGA